MLSSTLREMGDTVCGIATAFGNAGIAVVRISGSETLTFLRTVFKKKDEVFNPRYMYYGSVYLNGAAIDNGMAVYFPAPNSYTGEDMAEIHIHGGEMPSKLCLRALTSAGAKLASPGEFSKRAFLNGKLNLAEAEAVMDLITSSTEAQAKNALYLLRGKLSSEIQTVIDQTTHNLALIEALIEYPEEEDSIAENTSLKRDIEKSITSIDQLLQTCDQGDMLKNGYRIALAGLPNVGKSSLLNALLKRDAAIVTEIAGTTRDVIEGQLIVNNIPVILFDTAGIRETQDVVEKLGVERTYAAMDSANLILLITDAQQPLSDHERKLLLSHQHVVLVRNKCDVTSVEISEEHICISAKTGENLDSLMDLIKSKVGTIQSEQCLITNERHKSCLQAARNSAMSALQALNDGYPLDLIAIDLTETRNALCEITGEAVSEDIIDAIFSKFCLGK